MSNTEKLTEAALSNTANSDDENFEDAVEALNENDLELCIEEARQSLDLFLINRHDDARELMQPKFKQSIYHALGFGTISYLDSVITMDPEIISKCSATIRDCIRVCDRFRRRSSLSSNFTFTQASKANYYNEYTDLEAHAELCYAELSLLRSALTILENENMLAWVQAAMKIRECYRCYRECWKILHKRSKWMSKNVQETFESGTRMGLGMFNLMISTMPPKVLKLMEFVGFSGDRNFGLQQLYKAASLQSNLRAPLCSLSLITYYLLTALISGYDELRFVRKAQSILEPCLAKYPSSGIFRCLQGRIYLTMGEMKKGLDMYNSVVDTTHQWPFISQMCYWELIWCYAFQGDWIFAMKYSELLASASNWSKAICYYLKAAFMLQLELQTREVDKITPDAQLHESATSLMRILPTYAQRIAGKSIPFEKFVIKKAKRYMEQGESLMLPALEVLLVWNVLKLCATVPENRANLLKLLDLQLQRLTPSIGEKNFSWDDYCLVLTLKGNILRNCGPEKVEECRACFNKVFQNAKNVKVDTYLLPLCEMEMVYLAFAESNWKEAKERLENARSHRDYTLESRLQVRIQSAHWYMKNAMAGVREEEVDHILPNDVEELEDFVDRPGTSSAT